MQSQLDKSRRLKSHFISAMIQLLVQQGVTFFSILHQHLPARCVQCAAFVASGFSMFYSSRPARSRPQAARPHCSTARSRRPGVQPLSSHPHLHVTRPRRDTEKEQGRAANTHLIFLLYMRAACKSFTPSTNCYYFWPTFCYMFAIEWQKGCERQVAIQMTGVGLISAYGRRQCDLHARVIKALAVFEFEFY